MAAQQAADHKLKLAELLGLLVTDGMVSQSDADALIAERRIHREDTHPLTVISDRGWKSQTPHHRKLTLEFLTEWMAKKFGLEYFHIDPLKIDFSNLTDLMSIDYANRFAIMPIRIEDDDLVVATAEPFLRAWESTLEHTSRKNIRRVISSPTDINRYLVEFYNLARSVKSATRATTSSSNLASFEQLVELGKTKKQFDADDQHIVHIVDWLWQYAFDQRASDIHIEPRREIGLVRFRIDGVLHQVHQLPMSVVTAMTSRIKLLGRMDLMEKRRPQDGRVKTRTEDGQEIELRLSTLPTAFGEKLVMRIFDPEVLVRDFSELGFSDDDRARWQKMTSQPNGIILVTGPTGSGKTTTLYSALTYLNRPDTKIITLEDPVEYELPVINQAQINVSKGFTFAKGLRAILRQDPDILLVGEIRDVETAQLAIRAALTGHLVFSTLHTNSAAGAIPRLLDMGIEPFLLSATLVSVLAQRLVRCICKECAGPAEPDPAELELLGLSTADLAGADLRAGKGCPLCRQTGYRGRMAVFEYLRVTGDIRRMIAEGRDAAEIERTARSTGQTTLCDDAMLRMRAGLTTTSEVLKVVS